MSNALPLPPSPNLEQYKKLARDLQDACRSNDPGAIRQWAVRWVETLARLHGPGNWPAERRRDADAGQIELRWSKLREGTANLARCTLAGAQFFVAREHGFANWPKFARHVQELARAGSPLSAFEAAADAIVDGDVSTLRRLLADHPGLARERSTRDHHSTLLHYVSANGVESYRQKTPKNIVEITEVLLDAGAEVDAESDAYGGCTTLGLVATSVHPEQAGVQIALLERLLERGANLQHPSAGGNGHSVVLGCIANGQPAAGRFLADLGAPLDAETAAAVGRLDVLESYFEEGGAWRAGTDPKQIASGFLYACGYGMLDAARFLLDRGADAAARDDEGRTALHWASWGPEVEVIRLLLERGAPVDARDQRHATPLDTTLWTWNRASTDEERGRCYEAIALLARAGARLDRDYWRNRGVLEKMDSDSRLPAALRGEMP